MIDPAITKELSRRHRAWKRRASKAIPALAARVFALRGRPYAGSGFHYALERDLGTAIRIVSSLDARFDIADAIVDEVIVSTLFADVMRAERSLENHAD